MTREQLAVKIWGFESETEYNNVEVYMSFTRKKLAFVGSKVEIKAVRGLGYELREKKMFSKSRKKDNIINYGFNYYLIRSNFVCNFVS